MAVSLAGNATSEAVLSMIRQLQSRDSTVRAHEAAHVAAGGGVVTSGPQYSYQKGPDGKNYAIGGEVGIDPSPVPGNPRATLAKMATVRAAALAPAQPSATDLSVAAAASQTEAQARLEAYRPRQPEAGTAVDLKV